MLYGKLIGKGAFSKVYRKDDEPFVTVISSDYVKECLSWGWMPDDSLFPKVERIEYDEPSIYRMPYYPRVKAPKQELNERSYALYVELRKFMLSTPVCDNIYDLYDVTWEHISTIDSRFKKEKTLLRDALSALSNYGSDMCFEISPRNISKTNRGKLVLLDCFFFKSQLIKARSK